MIMLDLVKTDGSIEETAAAGKGLLYNWRKKAGYCLSTNNSEKVQIV